MNKKNNDGSATIRDVAQLSGSSVATVSRVFNRKANINNETFRKVIDAARNLNYRLDIIDSLDNKPEEPRKNRLIILCIQSLENPFYDPIFKGVLSSAKAKGYDVFITSGTVTENNAESYKILFENVNASGVILTSAPPLDYLKKIDQVIPVVQCGEYIQNSGIPAVSIDDYAATKRVMNYLYSIGIKKVALLHTPLSYKYSKERYFGYIDSLKEQNILKNPQWIMQVSDVNADMAFSAAVTLLSSANPPKAVYCVSDMLAAGVIRAAHYLKLKIPEDVAVVGFDNITISEIMIPSITTVSQPLFQMGYMASELLFEKIENPCSEVQEVLLDTQLIIRESTSRS